MVIKSFKIAIYRISSLPLFPKSFALPLPPARIVPILTENKTCSIDAPFPRPQTPETFSHKKSFVSRITRFKVSPDQFFFLTADNITSLISILLETFLRTVFPFFLKLSRKGSGARTTGCFTEKLPRLRTDACGKPTRPVSSFPEQKRKVMVFFFYGRPLRIFLTFFFLVTF